MSELPEIVIACVADDWHVLYVNGKNVYEGHDIEFDMLAAVIPGLRFRFVEAEVPDDGMYPSPERLDELTVTRTLYSTGYEDHRRR